MHKNTKCISSLLRASKSIECQTFFQSCCFNDPCHYIAPSERQRYNPAAGMQLRCAVPLRARSVMPAMVLCFIDWYQSSVLKKQIFNCCNKELQW